MNTWSQSMWCQKDTCALWTRAEKFVELGMPSGLIWLEFMAHQRFLEENKFIESILENFVYFY